LIFLFFLTLRIRSKDCVERRIMAMLPTETMGEMARTPIEAARDDAVLRAGGCVPMAFGADDSLCPFGI
jgi:hypothetical protein